MTRRQIICALLSVGALWEDVLSVTTVTARPKKSVGSGATAGGTAGAAYGGTSGGTSGTSGSGSGGTTTLTTTRDPALWPFTYTSPWNYPIGANATYAVITSDVTSNGFSAEGHVEAQCRGNTFIGKSGRDPVMNIYSLARNADGTIPGGGLHVYNSNTFAVHVPTTAVLYVGCGDSNLTIIDWDAMVAYDFGGAAKDGNGIFYVPAWDGANVYHVDLKGPGWGNGWGNVGPVGSGPDGATRDGDGMTSASQMPLFAGNIRLGELPSGKIPHALACLCDQKMKNRNAPGGSGHVWPASSEDGYAFGSPSVQYSYGSSGNLYMGSLVALPPNVNIAALGLKTPEAVTIAHALQDYGAYIVDTGGTSAAGISFAADIGAQPDVPGNPPYTGSSSGADFNHDCTILAHLLQVVTNSHHNGGAPTGGGVKIDGGDGALRAPVAPGFAR